MKFTCDSCGAQYMIGDEKLGKRGVKVRCKKCSYVIILRPAGYSPSDKKGADLEPSTADMTPSFEARVTIPPDAMGPTAPFDSTDFARERDDELAATSSELGLSKEFAAMGFDEAPRAGGTAPRGKALNVNLDVAKIEPVFPDNSSPFQIGATGGSLDEPADDELPRALAASLPRLHSPDDDSDEQTSVDQSPFVTQAPRQLDFSEDDGLDSTAPGTDAPEGLASLAKVSLGTAEPSQEAFNENSDDEALQTRRLAYDSAVKKEQKPVSISFDDDNLSDKLSALEKNEMADMHASLSQSLASQSDWGGKKQPPPAPSRATSGTYEPKPTKPNQPNLASLNALAAAADGDAPAVLPPFVSPSVAAAAPVAPMSHGPVHAASRQNGDSVMHEGPMLDNELKSAFDAMFSPASAATPAYQEGNLAANTVQESAPAELFRSAYPSTSDGDRRPTRVFDINAMQQVQAEQDLAQRPASITNGKKKTDEPEWYVAINDEQVGPMTFGEVRAKWELNELGPASLCWKQGMPDWTAIKNVKELEALGDMDDKVRTVVQRVEPNDETEDHADQEPPTIAHPDDDPRKQDVRATAPEKEDSEDEPSWRPSAASALASLAAAELSSSASEATPISHKSSSDVAVGRALPATSDALEKLLAGDGKSSPSSPFGSAEMSSSNIRPLPKRMDVTSSVSLRDPVAPLTRTKSYMIPAAIVGGFLFLGAVILLIALRSPSPQPSQQQVASLPPVVQQPVQQAVQQPTQNTEVKQPAETAPAPAAGLEKKEEPVAADVAKTENAAAKTELPKTEDVPAKSETPKSESKEKGEGRTKKAPREKEPREIKEERPRREEKKEKEELVDERPQISEEDDLLGGAPKKKKLQVAEPSNDLPDQLDDAQILGELRKHKATIQGCRQKQQSANPGLEGTMTVTFVIEGNGKTKRWDVQPSNFKSSVVGKCVIDSVKTWSFPKFSGRPMPVDFPVRVGGR